MRKHILFLLTFTSALIGYSQPVYLNPFSSHGIGNQIMSTDAIQTAMGGTSIAFSDSTMVSYLNSANIASLTKGYPLFSIGANGAFVNFNEGGQTYKRGFAALDHLIFAVPFGNRYGIALGLSPYARRGYSFNGSQTFGEDKTNFEYEGTGTISKAFVGLSYKVIDRKKLQFSLGSNVGYLFGTTTNSRSSQLGLVRGVALQSDRMQSLHYDFSGSFAYTLKDTLDRFHRIQLNGYFDPSQKLTGRYSDELFRIVYGSDSVTVASLILLNSINTAATFITGSTYTIGGNYTMQFKVITKKNKVYTSQLNFTGEYEMKQYAAFRKDYNAQSIPSFTGNYQRLSFGVQYTPDVDYYRTTRASGFFNKLKYRAGTYSNSLPYAYGGEYFTQFGTTFGIGIPMISSNAYSSLNIGVDLGRKSNGVAGALTEKYLGFNIGIIIAPSRADYWFRKVKLD